ncbi:hypothetical protein Q1695_012872 [Nippostrongylus brasiliensis]|nr:hypothetical protein Q1695_012872 [Nippostrongylus brasiliensis]
MIDGKLEDEGRVPAPIGCTHYVRSQVAPVEKCHVGPRQQMNMVSSFIDGGVVYGNTIEEAQHRRRGKLGKIGEEHVQPSLHSSASVLRTIFESHHNILAGQLKKLNPHWDDEQLYQEARRIVVAQIQIITVREYLPLLIGREAMAKFEIVDDPKNFADLYDKHANADTLNAFAAVVGQFFYAMDVLSSSAHSKIAHGAHADSPVTRPELGPFHRNRDGGTGFDVDFSAVIIHRGRDHGIPSYARWVEYCSGRKDLDDLLADPHEIIPRLVKIYEAVEDVDLLVLALAEKPSAGSLVGPTLSCIFGIHYQNVIHGDRFWYSNNVDDFAFTLPQYKALLAGTTLSRIICRVLGEQTHFQTNAFRIPDEFSNFPSLCNSTLRDDVSLNEWKKLPKQLPPSDQYIEELLYEAKKNVEHMEKDLAENRAETDGSGTSVMDSFHVYMDTVRAKQRATDMSRASDILLEATKLFVGSHSRESSLPQHLRDPVSIPKLNLDWFISQYCPPDKCLSQELPCDHTSKYRTHSGWCNNLQRPESGSAFQPLIYLLPPQYDDGIDKPRSTSIRGTPLPNPRLISNIVHKDVFREHPKYSHMTMQFGQFISHDITHSPVSPGPNNEVLNCTRCDSFFTVSPNCLPVPIPEGDPFFTTSDQEGPPRCLAFIRSLNGQNQLGPRRQINQLTSYIDGSVIYGSTSCESDDLREGQGGRLKTTFSKPSMSLPTPAKDQSTCRSSEEFPCFESGDERVSQHPAITAMHTLFIREHNRIATELSRINPHWDDEVLYQEARRIVGAEIAHICFNEFLPKILGSELVDEHDLRPKTDGYYTGYDSTCESTLSHSFSTAAYRLHTLTRRIFPRLDGHYDEVDHYDLGDNFKYADVVYDEEHGGIESILLGLVAVPSMAYDRHVTTALRNYLFSKREEPESGLDLIAINIMRGRDHGLPSYVDHREYCGFERPMSFESLSSIMDGGSVDALRRAYESVEDVDLFSGLVSEKPIKGAMVGSTAACIIAEQFARIKKCDRFHYENSGPQQFTPAQLEQIRQTTLSSVMCANHAWIRKLQPDAFLLPDKLANTPIDCSHLHRIDLSLWSDSDECRISKFKVLAVGDSARTAPCTSCTCTRDGLRCRPIVVNDCHEIMEKFSRKEMMTDISCVIQCSSAMGLRKL